MLLLLVGVEISTNLLENKLTEFIPFDAIIKLLGIYGYLQ